MLQIIPVIYKVNARVTRNTHINHILSHFPSFRLSDTIVERSYLHQGYFIFASDELIGTGAIYKLVGGENEIAPYLHPVQLLASHIGDILTKTAGRIYACLSYLSTNLSEKALLAQERQMMDPLNDILQDLRLERSFYARSDLRTPWGLAFSAKNGPSFHFVVAGRGFLRIDTERIFLEAGDLVLLPHDNEHQLSDPAEAETLPLEALPSERIGHNAALLRYDGAGERSLLICGGIRFAGPLVHPLLEILPRVLLLRREELAGKHAWLDTTLAMLETEALSLQPGSIAVMTRLADILVLQTIRAWLEHNEGQRHGWLGALSDPDIGRALALIHRCAEEPWTVASLAREVHLSRSVFSDRFSRLVGMPPMQYVTRWRIFLAGSWMRDERMSASEAAHRLGYSSEAAFSRAFKRYLQVPPGAFRRDT